MTFVFLQQPNWRMFTYIKTLAKVYAKPGLHCYLSTLARLVHGGSLRLTTVGVLWRQHEVSTSPRLAEVSNLMYGGLKQNSRAATLDLLCIKNRNHWQVHSFQMQVWRTCRNRQKPLHFLCYIWLEIRRELPLASEGSDRFCPIYILQRALFPAFATEIPWHRCCITGMGSRWWKGSGMV